MNFEGDAGAHIAVRLPARCIGHCWDIDRALRLLPENQMALVADPREAAMPKVINCDCGHVIFGANDEELIQNAVIHTREFHPAMVGKVSSEDLLGMAEDAP